MRAMLRRQTASALGACAAGVALPATVLLLVGRHEYMPGSGVHFWGVGFGAILATVAALSLTIVGWRRNDARTVLVGTAFSVMAALLALHGLATPGMIMGYEGGLGAFTGGATLLLGAAVLALAALPTVTEPQSVNRLVVLQIVLIVAIAILGAVGMLFPTVVPDVPEAGGTLALSLLAAGLLLYAFLGLRAINTYLLTRRRADLLVVLGLSFLATSLVAALVLTYMQLGWWLGHAFELFGIALVGIPIAVDLSRAQPSRSLTGGPRAGELVQAEQAFLGARVRALTLRLAEKDEYTEGHTRRVALRAVLVGEELGLPPNRLRSLATGGLLHDIGKLSVPDDILKKPGSLDQDEFEVIKRHPEWGHRLLGELGGFSDLVRRLVLDHHERLDGAGYPNGRTALELDLETRILTVCDVYDALLSVRVYRDAWTHQKAIGLLHEQTGTAFDPGCVAALERVLTRDSALVLGVAV
jgi:hypothetical protein